ncbi:hypothetical protein CHS0354_041885 [Potamilus streckersoni]|uniref:Medium-chain acyl-CoA ligase ACSF2, mitochondrial n=1 Tax=Potamilus streckersoni TaxID=2493646 RepID=A0AAE0W112_9BIVA|nr:hypothetical protein CHS0354_041885 [Potamilus streckersoni]
MQYRHVALFVKRLFVHEFKASVCYDEPALRYSSTSPSARTQEKLKWSYVHGPSDVPLRGITIGRALQEQVEKHPDKEALVFSLQDKRRTFSQLLEESDHLAAGLLSLGLKKGDRIGIWGPNSLEWVQTQYATARVGLILVGLKAIIAAEQFKDQNYYEMLYHVIPELSRDKIGSLKSHSVPSLKYVIMMGQQNHVGALKFSDVMQAASDKERRNIFDIQDKLQFDDPINIQFTSGTTGLPKGALLTHHNIVNNSYFVGRRLEYHLRETRICIPVPLYHCFGMVIGCLMIVNHASTCVFPAPAFNAGLTLKAVSDEKCTSLYGVPTMFIDMLNHHDFETFDLTSLYTGVMAGSPCPIQTMRQVVEKMHMPQVTVCYGTTENSPVTFQSFLDDKLDKRVSTVGRAHPHVEAKIVNQEGEIVPVGTQGELYTRGYMTMLNYWNEPDKTREVIKEDRWYSTADIAVMDEEGFVSICGRLKDMIIRGGENVYPLEIEQLLYKHPKIKDVQVIGVPDKRLGEEICAWIELKDDVTATDEEIRDYCKDKISKFKIPRYIHFVSEFPMTVTGKVQKYKIREEATKMLGLEHVTY